MFLLDNDELISLSETIGGSFGLILGLLAVLLVIYLINRWYKSRPTKDTTGFILNISVYT